MWLKLFLVLFSEFNDSGNNICLTFLLCNRADPEVPPADAPPADPAAAGEGGDGEIVGGPRNPQQIAAQKRLQQTQAQVDEVSVYETITKSEVVTYYNKV